MVESFGAAFATARAEGVFLGRGSGQKYRVKWTNLLHELILEYGPNHSLFKDPSKERPPKMPKIHGPQRLSQNADLPVPPASDLADAVEYYPSPDEISDPESAEPQVPGISSVHVGDYDLRMAPSFNCLDPRVPGLIFSHIVLIAFVPYITAKNGP